MVPTRILPALGLWLAVSQPSLATELYFEQTVRPLIEQYCTECHGHEQAKSGVNYQAFPLEADFLKKPELLDHMLWVVEEGEMPPRDAKQPSPEERVVLITWLDESLQRLQNASPNDPGFVVMPRLNMTQYERVIRDLTGVSIEVASMITPDSPAGEGFLNVGEAQTMSAAQFESFLGAAKKVLQYGNATPETGLLWHELPGDEAATPQAVRQELLVRIASWYTDQLTKQLGAHRQALLNTYNGVLAPYLEAAWRYHYREALEMPNATFAEIAAGFEAPLYPDSLKRLYGILAGDTALNPAAEEMADNLIMARLITEWNALPAPEQLDLKLVRKATNRLEQRFDDWREIDSRIYGRGRGGLDVIPSPRRAEARAQFRAASLQGTRLFDLDLTRMRGDRLYFIAGNAGDGSEGDRLRWQKGVLILGDGREVPWQEGLEDWQDLEGNPLQLESDGSLVVPAPFIFQARVPSGARRLRLEATISPDFADTSSVQVKVIDRDPEALLDEFGWMKGELVLGFDGHLTIDGQARLNGPQPLFIALRDAARSTSMHLRYTNVGIRTIHRNLTEEQAKFLEIPWPQYETRSPFVFFALHPDDIESFATPEDRARLDRMNAMLLEWMQPAQQRLAAALEESGLKHWPEGVLPDETTVAGWSSDLQSELRPLIEAAREERTEQDRAVAEKLRAFASRAWRRPAEPREIEEIYLPLYHQARAKGAHYELAFEQALSAILVSPPFLYQLREVALAGQEELAPLGPYELASRLSLALWGSMPDAELQAAAEEGRLDSAEGLAAEARRMLEDPRSEAFVEDFAGYWLGFAGFDQFSGPDAERFPEFKPALREAMFEETVLFLGDLFRHNRPLTNLIQSDYTFLNQTLANHYGIEGVDGREMRRVKLDSPERGGILGMGSFLTKTSSPLRTSPVLRGAWLLEKVIGEHLPPPPPAVPMISDDERDEEGLTIREQLERHREDPACFGCHDRMDPLGIALEQYDAIGRWREKDLAGEPIENTGLFISSGEEVTGIEGVRAIVLERQESFLRHFSTKLLGYFLGRAVTVTDRPLIDAMVEALQAEETRPLVAIDLVVGSRQFREHRLKPEDPSIRVSQVTSESQP